MIDFEIQYSDGTVRPGYATADEAIQDGWKAKKKDPTLQFKVVQAKYSLRGFIDIDKETGPEPVAKK